MRRGRWDSTFEREGGGEVDGFAVDNVACDDGHFHRAWKREG